MRNFTSLILGLSLMTGVGAYASPADEIITAEPAGTVQWYSGMSMAYSPSVWGFVTYAMTDGVARKMVYADDGYLYFRDPIALFPTGAYVKCELEEDQIILNVPQTIKVSENKNGGEDVWTIGLLVSERVYDEETGNWQTVWSQTDQDCLTFDRLADGRIVQNESDKDFRLTLFCNGEEMVYGDTDISMTPVNPETAAVRFPENVEAETWSLSYKQGARRVGHPVECATVGDDLYIRGFWSANPEAVIKGRLENGQLIIESGQYLGWIEKKSVQYFEYMMAYTQGAENLMTQYHVSNQPLVFNVDEASGTFTLVSDGPLGLLVKGGDNADYDVDNNQTDLILTEPGFQIKYGEYLDPVAPEFINDIYRVFKSAAVPFVQIEFCVLPFDLNGNVLDQNDLRYCVYFDGEKVLFEASTTFPNYQGITEPTYELPLDFSNNWGVVAESDNVFQHRVQMRGSDPEKVGVQVIFYDPETEVRKVSGIATYYPETKTVTVEDDPVVSVEELAEEGEVVEVIYHDLLGNRVSKDFKGVCVKSVVFDNGTVRNHKVMK